MKTHLAARGPDRRRAGDRGHASPRGGSTGPSGCSTRRRASGGSPCSTWRAPAYRDDTFEPAQAAKVVGELARGRGAETRAKLEEAAGRAKESGLEESKRDLDQRLKRAERGAERDEVLASIEILGSWYRDLVVVGAGADRAALNSDRLAELSEDAPDLSDRAGRAAEAVRDAWRSFEFNVSTGLALEALFVRLRQELGSSHAGGRRRLLARGPVYSFDPAGLDLAWNDRVICETAYGQEFARVVKANHRLDAKPPKPFRKIVRVATEEDRDQVEVRKAESRDALKAFREVLRTRKIEAKPVAAEVAFDGSRTGLRLPGRAPPQRVRRREGAAPPPRPPGGAALGRAARVRAPVRRPRAVRRQALLAAVPVPRAADHAADGEGPGSPVVQPHHRSLRAAALLPRVRASDVQELPRPGPAHGPPGGDAAGHGRRDGLHGARGHVHGRAGGRGASGSRSRSTSAAKRTKSRSASGNRPGDRVRTRVRADTGGEMSLCRHCGRNAGLDDSPDAVCDACANSPLCDRCGHERGDHEAEFAGGRKGCRSSMGDFQTSTSRPARARASSRSRECSPTRPSCEPSRNRPRARRFASRSGLLLDACHGGTPVVPLCGQPSLEKRTRG